MDQVPWNNFTWILLNDIKSHNFDYEKKTLKSTVSRIQIE